MSIKGQLKANAQQMKELQVQAKQQMKALQVKMDQLKENERFLKLPPEEQRVIIAKDVIKALKVKKIVATQGTYLRTEALASADEEAQVCEVLANAPNCEVCAIGAVFVAAVTRADNLKLGKLGVWSETGNVDDDDLRKYLSPFFSKRQLQLMEAAFESSNVEGSERTPGLKEAESFFIAHHEERDDYGDPIILAEIEDSNERLIAIMENVIANGGDFNPKQPCPALAKAVKNASR